MNNFKDDADAIAKLAGERTKMQEEMEKVRNDFTDLELFHLREEFNNVDADLKVNYFHEHTRTREK